MTRRIPAIQQIKDIGEVFGRFVLQDASTALQRGREILEERQAEAAADAGTCRHCAGALEARAVEDLGEVLVCPNASCPGKKKSPR